MNCPKQTLSLTRLLEKIKDIDSEWEKSNKNSYHQNLSYMIARRNTVEHYNDTILNLLDDERRVFNVTFKNFCDCAKKHFPNKMHKMPPVTQLFSHLEENQLKSNNNRNDTKFLKDYIKQNKIINPSFYYPESNIAKIYIIYGNKNKSN